MLTLSWQEQWKLNSLRQDFLDYNKFMSIISY